MHEGEGQADDAARPFLYSGPTAVTREFYQRLCTPVYDEYDVNYKKESLYNMFNRLQYEGTGIPLQRGGEFSVALAFPRLPREEQWSEWFFKELEEMESEHGIATHVFATLFAEQWNNAPFASILISNKNARALQASTTYMTPAMEVIMTTGANARSICKRPVVVHFLSGNRARTGFAGPPNNHGEPGEYECAKQLIPLWQLPKRIYVEIPQAQI
jgi:hypothetical protein